MAAGKMAVKKTETTEMDSDMRARVVALEQGQGQIVPRVSALEQWQRSRDIAEATREANWTALVEKMNERFTALEARIAEVAGTLKWIGRTIIGALILAFLAFVIQGGLHVP